MLTKTDLIDRLVARNDSLTRREAEHHLDVLIGFISEDLAAGGGVALKGFGKIYATDRKAGVGKNPRTGEAIQIAAKRTARFRPGKALAEQMNAAG